MHFARSTPIEVRKRRSWSSTETTSSLDSPSPPKGGVLNAKKERRRYRFAPRDSMASRLRVGRPGSRRFIRWESEFVLVQLLSDTESDMSSEELDYDSSCEPAPGFFGELFYQESAALAWDPLVDTTEEGQQRFLQALDLEHWGARHQRYRSVPRRGRHTEEDEAVQEADDDEEEEEEKDREDREEGVPTNPKTAVEAFAALSRRHQRVLRRHRTFPALEDICLIVHDFASEALHSDEARRRCVFSFERPFERLLVHAVAAFYGLVSFTRAQSASLEDDGSELASPTTVVLCRRAGSRRGMVADQDALKSDFTSTAQTLVFSLLDFLRSDADDEMEM